MGLFSKLFNGDSKKENKEEKVNSTSKFNEDYDTLKQYAQTILKYEYQNNFNSAVYSEVLPLCDEFIEIANNIDKAKALTRFRKEAKELDGKRQYPYHSVFKSVAFGNNDDWDRVVKNVKEVRYKLVRWDTGITLFNEKHSSIPKYEITLNEPTVKRNKLIEMPEIKYAAVGKSFNKDKLVSFVVIDTETTGLKASSERIIQLSAVKYAEWEAVETWNSFINPKRDVPEEATKINGITNEMLIDKPTIKEVHDSFLDFVGNSTVIGYNLPFDLKFLYAEGIDLTEQKRKYYDVLSIAKKVYKDNFTDFTLTDVANHNGIYFDAHNSLNDCFATAEVFEHLVDEIA